MVAGQRKHTRNVIPVGRRNLAVQSSIPRLPRHAAVDADEHPAVLCRKIQDIWVNRIDDDVVELLVKRQAFGNREPALASVHRFHDGAMNALTASTFVFAVL